MLATSMTYYTGKHYIKLADFLSERAEMCGMVREHRIVPALAGYKALLVLRLAEHRKGLCERATCAECYWLENGRE